MHQANLQKTKGGSFPSMDNRQALQMLVFSVRVDRAAYQTACRPGKCISTHIESEVLRIDPNKLI